MTTKQKRKSQKSVKPTRVWCYERNGQAVAYHMRSCAHDRFDKPYMLVPLAEYKDMRFYQKICHKAQRTLQGNWEPEYGPLATSPHSRNASNKPKKIDVPTPARKTKKGKRE